MVAPTTLRRSRADCCTLVGEDMGLLCHPRRIAGDAVVENLLRDQARKPAAFTQFFG
jgi:hypothetical protein